MSYGANITQNGSYYWLSRSASDVDFETAFHLSMGERVNPSHPSGARWAGNSLRCLVR